MKLIPLSQGSKRINYKLNLFAQVDDEDYDRLNKFIWYAKKSRNTYYVVRNDYSAGKQKFVQMHRIIMNTPSKMITDHKDHNGLNNQKSNLRICTIGENNRNVSCHKYGTSKYLGVSLTYTIKKGKKYSYWRAMIKSNGINIYIGTFKTEENAATAYNIFAEKYHGEFANYNKQHG